MSFDLIKKNILGIHFRFKANKNFPKFFENKREFFQKVIILKKIIEKNYLMNFLKMKKIIKIIKTILF